MATSEYLPAEPIGAEVPARNGSRTTMASDDAVVAHQPLKRPRLTIWLEVVVASVISLATAIGATWPLAMHISTALPLGCESCLTVPLLNVWTIWWNVDQCEVGWKNYWNSPIFFPNEQTFAMSEAQPTTTLVAPVLWATGLRVLAYNVYLLGQLTLNGLLGYLLVRSLGQSRLVAAWGAIALVKLPFVFWQLGVVQLTGVGGILWLIHATFAFGRHPTIARGFVVGTALGMTYWACNYYGLFAAVALLALAPLVLPKVWKNPCFWGGLLGAASIAAVMVGPIVQVQQQLARRHQWQSDRPIELIKDLSAHWVDYTRTPYSPLWTQPAWQPVERQNIWSLGVGLVTTGLAVVGVASCIWLLVTTGLQSERGETLLWLILLGVVSLSLSLGPGGLALNWGPYDLLRDFVPGFGAIRSPFRFGVITQIVLILLAAEGIERLRGFALKGWPWLVRLSLLLFMGACGLLSLAESWPDQAQLRGVPPLGPHTGWIDFVRTAGSATEGLLILPFPEGAAVEQYETVATDMYWGTFHERPLVAGYSGFFPGSYMEILDRIERFPANDLVWKLVQMGATQVVVPKTMNCHSMCLTSPDLALVYDEPAGPVSVFQLTPELVPQRSEVPVGDE
jgi:hypothetical protein